MNWLNSLNRKEKKPHLLRSLQDVMESGQYAEGEKVKQFERCLANWLECEAVALNSCGSALYLMFDWYSRQGYSHAAIQNNTFYATGAMALKCGMKVTLIDSAPKCPAMSVDSLREALNQGDIDLVVLTHIGGFVAQDYEAIAQLCKQRKIPLVEDCAHSLGVSPTGLYGEAATWSLYATKAIPVGEGGALTSKNPELIRHARLMRQYGKYEVKGKVAYDTNMLGMNLRMSEFEAAIACIQWGRRLEILQARERDANCLMDLALPLLAGPTNWYKYPVAKKWAREYKTVGGVYQESDQLHRSLPPGTFSKVDLYYSRKWAGSHVCLPVGEGLYDFMNGAEVKKAVRRQG